MYLCSTYIVRYLDSLRSPVSTCFDSLYIRSFSSPIIPPPLRPLVLIRCVVCDMMTNCKTDQSKDRVVHGNYL